MRVALAELPKVSANACRDFENVHIPRAWDFRLLSGSILHILVFRGGPRDSHGNQSLVGHDVRLRCRPQQSPKKRLLNSSFRDAHAPDACHGPQANQVVWLVQAFRLERRHKRLCERVHHALGGAGHDICVKQLLERATCSCTAQTMRLMTWKHSV